MAEQLQEVWELHRADVGEIVKTQTARLLNKPTDPPGKCKADVRTMRKLVDGLENYTEQVFGAALSSGWLGGTLPGIASDDTYWLQPSQWALDFSRWQERLAAYKDALDVATPETGVPSCTAIFEQVTEPMLLGWYQPGTPGIVNPEVQTIPDIATPFMLGNQVFEYRDAKLDALRKLIDDVIANAKALAKTGARGLEIGLKVAAVVVLGFGTWKAYDYVSSHGRRNRR